MELHMKRRITVSVADELLDALDDSPGINRSEKVERLLRVALAAREQHRWVSELRAFYKTGHDTDDRQEDLEWQALAAEAFEREE
jgi:metal-responsive CopG/Arc/MetJ family transcriptional regulator